jgi:catechol 2,3-dioxygenase-like lactoylglutathione lyase family enzyme
VADDLAGERPSVWVGHVLLPSRDVGAATAWYRGLGMRFIAAGDGFGVLELRGGTHLVVLRAEHAIAEGSPAPFDLMVEDIEASHRRFAELGLAPTPLARGAIHTSFRLRDPSGYELTVNSSHVSDQPV